MQIKWHSTGKQAFRVADANYLLSFVSRSSSTSCPPSPIANIDVSTRCEQTYFFLSLLFAATEKPSVEATITSLEFQARINPPRSTFFLGVGFSSNLAREDSSGPFVTNVKIDFGNLQNSNSGGHKNAEVGTIIGNVRVFWSLITSIRERFVIAAKCCKITHVSQSYTRESIIVDIIDKSRWLISKIELTWKDSWFDTLNSNLIISLEIQVFQRCFK